MSDELYWKRWFEFADKCEFKNGVTDINVTACKHKDVSSGECSWAGCPITYEFGERFG